MPVQVKGRGRNFACCTHKNVPQLFTPFPLTTCSASSFCWTKQIKSWHCTGTIYSMGILAGFMIPAFSPYILPDKLKKLTRLQSQKMKATRINPIPYWAVHKGYPIFGQVGMFVKIGYNRIWVGGQVKQNRISDFSPIRCVKGSNFSHIFRIWKVPNSKRGDATNA